MPILKVETKSAEKVWSSPDGQRTIYKLTLDYEGKPVGAKTYSQTIATVGWSGEAEIYEKEGRNGTEAFVRQLPKEGGYSSGSQAASRGGYQPKDDKAIKAMFAIKAAVELHKGKPKTTISDIEADAQELYAMVDRVKASEDAPEASLVDNEKDDVLPGQLSIEDIKKVFPEE